MATQWASDFAKSMNPGVDLSCSYPKKFYSESGKGLGYIVSYNYDRTPHGYIVFDTSHESLISQFSFTEGVKDPYETALDNADSEFVALCNIDSDLKAYKTGSFAYSFADIDEGLAITEQGEMVNAPNEAIPADVNPSDWSDIFVPVLNNYSNYSFGDTATIPEFLAYPQDYVMRTANRYACGVSAMITCVDYYYSKPLEFGPMYLDLWVASATSVTLQTRCSFSVLFDSCIYSMQVRRWDASRSS